MSSEIIKRPDYATKGRKNDVCSEFETPDGSFKGEMNFSNAVRGLPTPMLQELMAQIAEQLRLRRASGGGVA